MTEPTKIPLLPTRLGSDEGETHTWLTASTDRSFRSLAGVFGGGKSDHHVTDSAGATSASIHNRSPTASLSGPQKEVFSDGADLKGGEVDKGTIGISDQAGIQAGEKKTGIPLPGGGLRRGRSTEFAGLSERGSLDQRGCRRPSQLSSRVAAGGIPGTLG